MEACNFPDLVLLTEHWLHPDECFNIPNYQPISLSCRENSLHGGTLILSKQSFTFLNINKFDYLRKEESFEISAAYCKQLNLLVFCVYRSPSSDPKEFLNKLDGMLCEMPPSSKVILAGDFNIDFSDRHNINTTMLSNLLTSYGLLMHVNFPTRITDTSATIIDYVCSNIDGVTCSVLHSGLSDHEAVSSVLVVSPKNERPPRRQKRILCGRSFKDFKNRCAKVHWDGIDRAPDPVSLFHRVLLDNFHRSFPLRWFKSKPKRASHWLTSGLRNSSKNLRSLNYLRKFFKSTWFILKCDKYRDLHRKLVDLAKRNYYNHRLLNSGNRQKESWRIINEIRRRASKTNEVGIDSDTLNRFYCGIASTLTQNLPLQTDPLSYLSDISVSDSFYFIPVEPWEVAETLTEIKNKKSTGDDEISAEVLSNLPNEAWTSLANAINNSFDNGCFPSCLKSSIVIPLHKGGSVDVPSNFRPISLLPTLSKLIEKLVKKRMWDYLTKFKLMASRQYGFQSSRGTHDAIFEFLDRVYTECNGGEAVAAVFCDLSKAFDCVDHGILLGKLERYGFRGKVLDWFESYLSCRTQSVVSAGSRSSPLRIDCGVPQGSVLGPILFLLYINDLVRLKITGEFTLFADDTSVMWHHKNIIKLRKQISQDLIKIKNWCNANKLCLNTDKTNIMGFKCNMQNINLGDDPLQAKDVSRFLGLHIDIHLKFNEHIFILSKKLSSGCFAVRSARSELGPEIARSVYFALFESHLRYGIPFWGSAHQYLLQILFVLQKKAVRAIAGVHQRESCRPHFVSQRILTLTSIFVLETATLVFKNFSNVRRTDQPSTRQNLKLMAPLPIPKTALVQKSLIYEGRKVFNHLPFAFRLAASSKQFRKQVKNFLLDKPYYSLTEYYDDHLGK